MAGLYYLGIMQAIVGLFARLFHRTIGLSGAESLSGAANIFVGIEAGLIVQPYLAAMTRSELLMVLTCMMATGGRRDDVPPMIRFTRRCSMSFPRLPAI